MFLSPRVLISSHIYKASSLYYDLSCANKGLLRVLFLFTPENIGCQLCFQSHYIQFQWTVAQLISIAKFLGQKYTKHYLTCIEKPTWRHISGCFAWQAPSCFEMEFSLLQSSVVCSVSMRFRLEIPVVFWYSSVGET